MYRIITDSATKEIKSKELILNNHSRVLYDYNLIPEDEIREYDNAWQDTGVIRDNSGHNVRDIKEAVGGLLPDYMLPAIKIVDSIPLNENGKFNERIMDCRKNEG